MGLGTLCCARRQRHHQGVWLMKMEVGVGVVVVVHFHAAAGEVEAGRLGSTNLSTSRSLPTDFSGELNATKRTSSVLCCSR